MPSSYSLRINQPLLSFTIFFKKKRRDREKGGKEE
jgi:hypothetical protein